MAGDAPPIDRRAFLTGAAALATTTLAAGSASAQSASPSPTPSLRSATPPSTIAIASTALTEQLLPPLAEFSRANITITGAAQLAQRHDVLTILLGLAPADLVQPLLAMAGRPSSGNSLGGWYAWKPDFDFHHDEVGFAPASTLGQWISALARFAVAPVSPAATPPPPNPNPGARALELTAALADAVSPSYFAQTRFAAYTTDKLVCGLIDSHQLLSDPKAFSALARVIDAATPSLPGRAIHRDTQWKMGADLSWMWDESYTLPENLYLAYTLGAGDRYRKLAQDYLEDNTLFEPLSRNENALSDRHAYSHVNALCSAMQAWLVDGSAMHLAAARNGFRMVELQSYATGGWGPDELLRKPGYDDLAKSLTATHNTFEAPCCGYAHLKLARYLLRVTRDAHYGDTMERVLFNTLLGVLPLQPDGRAFYYADYNQVGRRIYSIHRWPCCSGTLPQVVADYGINTYLRGPAAVYVNLYQPSELRWTEAGADLHLTQTTDYPFAETVRIELTASRPVPLALHLRLPEWAGNAATLKINGHPAPLPGASGASPAAIPSRASAGSSIAEPASRLDRHAGTSSTSPRSERASSEHANDQHGLQTVSHGDQITLQNGFVALARTWHGSTTVELTLPLRLRLETLPTNGGPEHHDAVALVCGPLVLFAVRDPADAANPIDVRETSLLQAARTGPREWTVETLKGVRRFVPFTELGDSTYSTYVHLV